MGQTPVQKAAQPTKRTGKQWREAGRAAAVKKKAKAAGRGAAASAKQPGKAPLGTVRAQFGGVCPVCERGYGKGSAIRKVGEGWGHPQCAPSKAELEFARNKARFEAGVTFRSRKRSDWRMGASPSNTKPAR